MFAEIKETDFYKIHKQLEQSGITYKAAKATLPKENTEFVNLTFQLKDSAQLEKLKSILQSIYLDTKVIDREAEKLFGPEEKQDDDYTLE